jgi:hypothetical protein
MCSPLALVLACSPASNPAGDDDGGVAEETGGINVDPSTSTSGGLDDGLDDESGSSGSTGEPQLFACNQVDFIFVVDNSSSMADEQKLLAQGVPGFVAAMQNALPISGGFRVGVIDTDSYPALGTLEAPLDGCPDDGTADCDACDYQLGGFLDKPTSASDVTLTCDFSTGLRFMDGTSETFANEFGCAALVGAEGNPIEQQAGALVSAVSSDMNATCNDDFVRDGALLVFLLISDEEDNHENAPAPQGGSMGEPQGWYEALVAAKNDRPDNIVALGLLGGSPKFDDCAELSDGIDGAEQSSRLVDFVERFPGHFVGSVCSDNYGSFFQDALVKVAEGCQNFIP